MPRGPEEQGGFLAGGRGAGEVRDGHGCGGAAEETGWSLVAGDFLVKRVESSQSVDFQTVVFKLTGLLRRLDSTPHSSIQGSKDPVERKRKLP